MIKTCGAYTLTLRADLRAFHRLPGAVTGFESERHVHCYGIAVRLQGSELDGRGYLVDVVHAGKTLNGILERYRDRLLNDMDGLRGLPPTMEHFARVICRELIERLDGAAITAVEVSVAENEKAEASYREELSCT